MDATIEVLNACFIVCLAFTILFFIITVVLFFLFDIVTIFNIRTGRAQAKTIKEMQAANASTGRLRIGNKTQTTKLTPEQKNKNRAPAVAPPPQVQNVQQAPIGAAPTDVLNTSQMVTDVLPNAGSGNNQPQFYNETQVLSQAAVQNDNVKQAGNINFVITKKIVCIHTQEVIS